MKNCTDRTVCFKTKKKIEKVEESSTGDSDVFGKQARAGWTTKMECHGDWPADPVGLGVPRRAGRKATVLRVSRDDQGAPRVQQRAQWRAYKRRRLRNIIFQSLRGTSLCQLIHVTMVLKPTFPSFGLG